MPRITHSLLLQLPTNKSIQHPTEALDDYMNGPTEFISPQIPGGYAGTSVADIVCDAKLRAYLAQENCTHQGGGHYTELIYAWRAKNY
jgi:hypothetical protein